MSLHPSHLDYFKSLLEGTADISWNAWFDRHESELRDALPRAEFLRLKFSKLEEAEKHLKTNKVAYRRDPLAFRRETYYSLLGPEVLDEKGRPLESFRRAAYDGARGQLIDGEVDEARETLRKFVQKVRRFPAERRQQEIEGLCFDGEMELLTGNADIGRVLLQAVTNFPLGNALTDFAVKQAMTLLEKLGSRIEPKRFVSDHLANAARKTCRVHTDWSRQTARCQHARRSIPVGYQLR